MKRLLASILFLFTCSPAFAAIAYVAASGTNCSQVTASAGAACTLTAATVAGDDVLVGLSWKTTTASINMVTGNVSGSYFFPYAEQCNGTGTCAAILVCRHCAALTSITPTFSAATLYELNVGEYSGVAWLGVTAANSASNAAAGLSFITGDANDYIVTETSSIGSNGIPATDTGSLRQANRTSNATTAVAGALIDNTVAAAGSVSALATITSSAWAAAGVELRTAAAKTYIWPDCDTSHPCEIFEKDTVALGTSTDTLNGFVIRIPPSLAGNALVVIISHPSAKTISSFADNNAQTWTSGVSVTDTTNAETTEARVLCNAATGTSQFTIAFSAAITNGDMVQFSFKEISGIAASGCYDSGAGAFGNYGTINTGSFTTTGTGGDFILLHGINASDLAENGRQAGVEMVDDSSSMVVQDPWQQYMSGARWQPTAGAVNPTYYVNALDVNNRESWNFIGFGLKAGAGLGTQPSGIHVVRDIHFINSPVWAWETFPTNGNVVVLSTSNPSVGYSMANATDNQGATYTRTAFTNATTDPQQLFTCLGAGGANKDRTLSWTVDATQTHVEIYDISGAKQSGTGSTFCVGNTTNNQTAYQGAGVNANIVGAPVFTAALNAGTTSLVITTSYVGTGPPTGPCVSGGIAPPTCTGQTTGVVFDSIFATGMSDSSSWSTGDPYLFYYTNSTASKSIDYLMANGQGGTNTDAAGIEILGQATTVTRHRAWVIQ